MDFKVARPLILRSEQVGLHALRFVEVIFDVEQVDYFAHGVVIVFLGPPGQVVQVMIDQVVRKTQRSAFR